MSGTKRCFFFNDPATTQIYTLSLHDALPIYFIDVISSYAPERIIILAGDHIYKIDRKSTRLNSSHANTSYAVFCLKKKTRKRTRPQTTSRRPAPTTNPAPRPDTDRTCDTSTE